MKYQRQIREVFNPNDLGDDLYAVLPDAEEKEEKK